MILVTVGSQMPFDRLVRAVDDWCGRTSRSDVLAQIGPGAWKPRHARFVEFMTPDEFRENVRSASLIIGHAGMGTLLTCLQFARPLIVMPRRAMYGETRNDHQVATVDRFASVKGLTAARDEGELAACLDRWQSIETGEPIGQFAEPALIHAIRDFIRSSLSTADGQPGPADDTICAKPTR